MTCEEIEQRIRQAFPKCAVVALDLTGTLDHFEVRISDPELAHLARIRQHRAIMDLFALELKSGEVHALAVKPLNP